MITKKERRELKKAFDIEYKRTDLAKKGKYEKLEKEYKFENWGIKDLNTPTLWDRLNSESIGFGSDPMTFDRLETVLSFLKNKKSRVLDIGFGSARLEKMASLRSQLEMYGIDVSPHSVKLAKKILPEYKFTVGSIQKLNYRDYFFGYVVALDVLEHIKPNKIFDSLKEIHRVLKRRGKFIVSVPLNEGLEELLLNGKNPNAHLRIYSEELIKAELAISGFKILWSKNLYAFRNFYNFKTFIVKILLPFMRQPNNIIILAEKK